MSAHAHRLTSGTIDASIVSTMRLVLAVSALLISTIASPAAEGLVVLLFVVLALYVGYSAVLYLLARRAGSRRSAIRPWMHWTDVAWYVVLIALSGGTGSIFFLFFFFAILVASFRWGFASGLRVAGLSALLFAIVGLATAPRGLDFELARFVIRPIYLLVLGSMMAYWGGFEITLRRYLAMLSDVTSLSLNPRFGMDRTLGQILERLRAFYDADACLLVTLDPASGEYCLWRAGRQDPEATVRGTPIPPEIGRQLLALPVEQVVMYNGGNWASWRRRPRSYAYDALTGARQNPPETMLHALATTLDVQTYVSAPMRRRGEFVGRFFVMARQDTFQESDAVYLLQIVDHMMPAIEHSRLVDRSATEAAEQERQRFVRDLHDTVIQSVVGVQLGLVTSWEKIAAGGPDAMVWVDQLVELTNAAVADIRAYMRGLQSAGEHEGSLVSAVRRFAQKLTEVTGITVRLQTAPDLHIDDRLAADVFQIVIECLESIRKYTESTQALIDVGKQDDRLILRIENDRAGSTVPASSAPDSLAERVSALGGHFYVDPHRDGQACVIVEIPL